MRVRWSRRAELDLYEIGDYIAQDDAIAAVRWVDRLRDQARLAARVRVPGRVVPEIDRPDIREVHLRSYRIIFRVDAKGLIVLTVLEGHRRLPDDFDPDAEV